MRFKRPPTETADKQTPVCDDVTLATCRRRNESGRRDRDFAWFTKDIKENIALQQLKNASIAWLLPIESRLWRTTNMQKQSEAHFSGIFHILEQQWRLRFKWSESFDVFRTNLEGLWCISTDANVYTHAANRVSYCWCLTFLMEENILDWIAMKVCLYQITDNKPCLHIKKTTERFSERFLMSWGRKQVYKPTLQMIRFAENAACSARRQRYGKCR